MLEMHKTQEGSKLTVVLDGRLDAKTSPELERELTETIDDVSELYLDMAELEYVSSAGLRVLLYVQGLMDERDATMVLLNVSDEVLRVFKITGFLDLLTIQ